jgi:hypothetical protein
LGLPHSTPDDIALANTNRSGRRPVTACNTRSKLGAEINTVTRIAMVFEQLSQLRKMIV